MKTKKLLYTIMIISLLVGLNCNKRAMEITENVYTKGKGYLLLVAPLAVDYVYKSKGQEAAVELINAIAQHAGNIKDIRRGGTNSRRLGAIMEEIRALYQLTKRVEDPRLKEAEKWLERLSTAIDLIPVNFPAFELENETDWEAWALEQKQLLGVERPVEIRALEAQLIAADGGRR